MAEWNPHLPRELATVWWHDIQWMTALHDFWCQVGLAALLQGLEERGLPWEGDVEDWPIGDAE